MAARLVCDGRIQAINHSVSSSKRTAQVAAATPTNSRIVSARQMVPALTPALLSARARARDVSMAAVAPTEAGAPVNPLEGEVSTLPHTIPYYTHLLYLTCILLSIGLLAL